MIFLVPCPLDQNHTVDKDKLDAHLMICNSRAPAILPPYIKYGINVDEPDDGQQDLFRLQDLSPEVMNPIIDKINDLYEKHIAGNIKDITISHKILEVELANESYGAEKKKHLLQTSSILGIMEKENFLQPKTCYIEFGAGKGTVSYWLARTISNLEKSKVLLIDRESHRHKKDNRIRDRNLIDRIRADIADLDLKGLSQQLDKCDSIFAISKHLCGAATDLTIKCIVQGSEEAEKRIKGFLICVCCHHRCTWNTFVGKKFFVANGIDKSAFNIIIKMVSWFTCGDGINKLKSKNDEQLRHEHAKIGWKCKRLIDFARLNYAIENGYDCTMNYYADKATTLENVCLVGKYRIS